VSCPTNIEKRENKKNDIVSRREGAATTSYYLIVLDPQQNLYNEASNKHKLDAACDKFDELKEQSDLLPTIILYGFD
jgi:hypothetical protein